MKKPHKAVSPVVATLLLILIAIAAAVVLYAWVSNLSTSTKATGAERTGTAFTIEAATLKNHNSTFVVANVYVRNIGSVSIDNGTWSLYVVDPETDTVVTSNTTWTFGQSIAPGDVLNTSILLDNSTGTIKAGEFYIVKVVSPQGATDSIYVKAES